MRAKLVHSLAQLDDYPWCGHGSILGVKKREWQDNGYVLRWFGSKEGYREFVEQGIGQGSRPELVGGGLIRSQGGWSAVKGMRQSGAEQNSDERVLGSGEFVDRLLADAEEKIKPNFHLANWQGVSGRSLKKHALKEKSAGRSFCQAAKGNQISAVRAELARVLVEEVGISLRGARQIGNYHVGRSSSFEA